MHGKQATPCQRSGELSNTKNPVARLRLLLLVAVVLLVLAVWMMLLLLLAETEPDTENASNAKQLGRHNSAIRLHTLRVAAFWQRSCGPARATTPAGPIFRPAPPTPVKLLRIFMHHSCWGKIPPSSVNANPPAPDSAWL